MGRCVGKVVGGLAGIPAAVRPVVTVSGNFYVSSPVSRMGDGKAVTGAIIDRIVVVTLGLHLPTM